MSPDLTWVPLADPSLRLSGLPWHVDNAPRLWRLPAEAMDRVPDGVRRQALFPAGAALRFRTDTGALHVKAASVSEYAGQGQGLDLYVDGSFWCTVAVTSPEETDLTCFEGCSETAREVTLYLPHRREVRIPSVGIRKGATIGPPSALREERPLVIYGSSVAQGAGVSRPGMAYGNILARGLGLEVVNLGFGGAGKAEPEVVDLVTQVDACCYLFDLGKSYGLQDRAPYLAMLRRLRSDHPDTPFVCVTPIFSTREAHEPEYADLSRHTRDVVASAFRGFQDDRAVLVDGLQLLGPHDADGLSSDGVHPGDLGAERIAEGLRQAAGGHLCPASP